MMSELSKRQEEHVEGGGALYKRRFIATIVESLGSL
jgi:hypothetical protein